MKTGLNKIERTAGIFVVLAGATFVLFMGFVAFKQNWFQRTFTYKTLMSQGEGIHPGTLVQMAGLRAGKVDSVRLDDENRIEIVIVVDNEFHSRVKKDSVARVIRPFVIGDKVVEVTLGSKTSPLVADMGEIPSQETTDIMDLLGGGKLGPYLATLDSLLKNIQGLVGDFAEPQRAKAIITLMDELVPTLADMRELTGQMTRNKAMSKSLAGFTQLSADMNRMLPMLEKFVQYLPKLGETTAQTMEQVNKLTTEMNKFIPIFAKIAPTLPEVSLKSVQALREAVVVLRAMQKSFLLKGSVKEVKEEDEKQREPASHD